MSLEVNKSVPLSILITDTNTNININKNKTEEKNNINQLNRDMFEFKYVIGKGGFGKVWQVIYKKTQEKYALKEMSKTKIIDKKSQKFINNELTLLKKLNNDFIVNMYYAFQDNDNLYLVIDFLSGGDLRYHVSRYHTFSEEQTRFFISCIIQGLSHIHSNNIIHRDIKPENLVLDSRGYVRITDFGIAKENEKDNSSETSGTPGYMSPEVILKKNHTFTTDFFAIGVIGYEFMKGRRPFIGTRNEIKENMSNENYYEEKIKIKKDDKIFKKGWSWDCVDFINSLLDVNMNKRLGNKYGIKELKNHQWLKYYLWDEIENKSLESPFVPDLDNDNFDKDYCKDNDILTEKTKKRYAKIISSDKYKNAFADFYYNKDLIKKENKKISKEKKIVIDGNNTENVLNKNLSNNHLTQNTNYKNNNKNNNEIYIKKLFLKNPSKKENQNRNIHPYNYYSPPPKILSSKNIFSKYYKDSNSNLSIKSYNNINHKDIVNINIINIKDKNTFTNANTPLVKNNNNYHNMIYKKVYSKKKLSYSKGKIKQIKSGLSSNFEKYKFKNKAILDLFLKNIYNPFHKKNKIN